MIVAYKVLFGIVALIVLVIVYEHDFRKIDEPVVMSFSHANIVLLVALDMSGNLNFLNDQLNDCNSHQFRFNFDHFKTFL